MSSPTWLWYMLVVLAAICGALRPAEGGESAGTPPTAMRHYALLEQARDRYQELVRQPDLSRLPPLPSRSVQPGETYEGMPALRKLLSAVGDLPHPRDADPVEPATLDAATTAALKRFQERHGLQQDGILGPATWRALTKPLAARLHQIERTLDRWRSLPVNPHPRAIFINIPRFRLYALRGADDREGSMLQMDVVVGRDVENLRTPAFTAELTHLIFRPYWDVPRSITLAEILPAARRSPDYLQRRGFELVDRSGNVVPASGDWLDMLADGSLRVRQRPGDGNALGSVKFMLPNPANVYLHDTPDQGLFARAVRAFSHGCIRVSAPAALAQWLLEDDADWNAERIAAAMRDTSPLQVNLVEPVLVYIVYGTAIAREDGSVLFLDDLYGLDRD